jgi:uncharacterized protein YndB with AHSA1/START domain
VIRLKQSPETVFAALENSEDLPNWSAAVLKMEKLPDLDGKPTARMTLKWGHTEMIVTQLERKPPTRLVTRMAKENGPVFGTWTYDLAAEPGGCRIALTEDGEMINPFYRAIGRLRGLDANIRQTLSDLARKFGEAPEITMEFNL